MFVKIVILLFSLVVQTFILQTFFFSDLFDRNVSSTLMTEYKIHMIAIVFARASNKTKQVPDTIFSTITSL